MLILCTTSICPLNLLVEQLVKIETKEPTFYPSPILKKSAYKSITGQNAGNERETLI